MLPDSSLIEILEYHGPGYKPLMAFGAWRVAVLNYIAELLPAHLDKMQRHDLTDEIFVLLQGRCILFLGEGRQGVERIHAVDLQPGKAYNVRQGVWHTHTLAPGAEVLIVENDDTAAANSPSAPLSPAQTAEIVALTRAAWQA
jgi:mannose-6-phosphate isomerase-like protein (cupin superfamily)